MADFFKSAKFKILLAILIILFVFMLRAEWTGGLSPMTSQVLAMITTPFQKISSAISYKASDFFGTFINAKEISQENEELRKKVAELNGKIVDYDKFKRENEQLKAYLDIKALNPEFDFEPATVIGRDPNSRFYSFTIDKGTLHGIKIRDTVITSEGIVGVIDEVGLTYSKVITILDVSLQIGSYVSSTRDVGVMVGGIEAAQDGNTYLTLLTRDSEAKIGDVVLTSGYGGIYPKDIIVGEIIDIKPETHGMSRYALVKPSSDIRNIKDVLVIKDFFGKTKEDILDLENEKETLKNDDSK